MKGSIIIDNVLYLGAAAILLWAIFSQIPGTYSPFQGKDTTGRWILALMWTAVFLVFYYSVYRGCAGTGKMWPFSWGPFVKPDMETGFLPPCADKIFSRVQIGEKPAAATANAQRERVYAAAAKAIESAISRPVINPHCDGGSSSGGSSSSASSMAGDDAVGSQMGVNYSAAVGEFYNQ